MEKVILKNDYMEIFEKNKETYNIIIPDLKEDSLEYIKNKELNVISAEEATIDDNTTVELILVEANIINKPILRIPSDLLIIVEDNYERESTKDRLLGTKKKFVHYDKLLDVLLSENFLFDIDSIDTSIYHLLMIKDCVVKEIDNGTLY